MAEFEWTRPVAPATARAAPQWLRRLTVRLTDWEDWLTLVLALGATMCVSLGLEQSGWSDDMPSITLVSVLAIVASLLIARSGLSIFAAWPLAMLTGVLVVFWQTLEIVGPGNFEQRMDAIYLRFETWFDLAFHGGVSNDALPFNVLVLALTWLGVFIFGWSVYRWENAWIGLIPGGLTLFLDLALVGDNLEGSVLLYMLFGFLLVMRTNLMTRMSVWRREGTSYPSLISLSFLNFSTWALLFLIVTAWVLPVGPFATPAPVDAMVRQVEEVGVNFVRLSGPLHVKRVIPVHNFTGVLPFQGSIELGDRELLTVRVNDPGVSGEIRLRGAVYDEYGGGGWKAGARTSVDLPAYIEDSLKADIASGATKGQVIPLTVTVDRNSVVGSVLFSPGEPISASTPFQIEAPSSGFRTIQFPLKNGGEGATDQEILSAVKARMGEDFVGLTVDRDERRGVVDVGGLQINGGPLPDGLVARPENRVGEGRSYNISGFIPIVPEEELRQASGIDPDWVLRQYIPLPEDLPDRVRLRAEEVTAGMSTRYDKALRVQDYLRSFPIDFSIPDTPPGRDAIDYFLFDSMRGYFDYHASAMAVMLRELNIPARLAVGFVIDEADKNLESGAYTIRDRNSYAWTEVYFPSYGWIAFNPSPDRPGALNPAVEQNSEPDKALTLKDFPGLPVTADPVLDTPGDQNPSIPVTAIEQKRDYNPLLTLAAAVFIALLAGSVYLGWQRSVAGLPYSQQLWEKTVRLATWAGYGPRTGQTPAEFARSLGRSVRQAKDVSMLAAAYNRSRFGKREPAEEKARLAEFWSPLRNALLGSVFRRVTRRGRRPNEDR
ncbi:MAG: transglutaminase domain-containing protein [Chloroflexi bacterium]|nr:MAG: transglutaminase domain-containing protein [Chloroflexota bacterium]